MRTTIALDDELIAKAQEFTGLQEKSALLREALKALIARESGKRLALLGGTEPQMEPIPRRRSKPVWSWLTVPYGLIIYAVKMLNFLYCLRRGGF